MTAKMSKKKTGSGGGKRKEKLENMKKEMEIVSTGLEGWGGGRWGGGDSCTVTVLSPPHRMTTSCPWQSWNRNTRPV